MVKVKVIADGFVIGMQRFNKGDVTELPLSAARYAMAQGTCERVGDEPKEPPPKKAAKKKRYVRRDVKAEE